MSRSISVVLFAALLCLVGSCHSDNSMPTQPVVNPTPVPTAAPAAAHAVSVGQGGANSFVDAASGTSTTTIKAGQTVQWNFVGGLHSTTSGNCCQGNGVWDSGTKSSGSFSHTFPAAGQFPYFCTVHGSMMTGMVSVTP